MSTDGGTDDGTDKGGLKEVEFFGAEGGLGAVADVEFVGHN